MHVLTQKKRTQQNSTGCSCKCQRNGNECQCSLVSSPQVSLHPMPVPTLKPVAEPLSLSFLFCAECSFTTKSPTNKNKLTNKLTNLLGVLVQKRCRMQVCHAEVELRGRLHTVPELLDGLNAFVVRLQEDISSFHLELIWQYGGEEEGRKEGQRTSPQKKSKI